jgi:Fic family protein
MCLATLLAEIDTQASKLNMLRLLDERSIREAVAIEYTYESNRIEGNTLTLRETDIVVNKGLTIGGKPMRDHLEAINHHEAIYFLLDFVRSKEVLTERNVKDLHAIVLRGIDRDNAGVYRLVPVMISGSRHVPPSPLHVAELMQQCFAWYEAHKARLHPVILAAEMHERIATIHPFIDGNGRTARLVMNLVLLQSGLAIANIPGDTDSRKEYYDSLEQCNLGESKLAFHTLIAQYVHTSFTKYLKLVDAPAAPDNKDAA